MKDLQDTISLPLLKKSGFLNGYYQVDLSGRLKLYYDRTPRGYVTVVIKTVISLFIMINC